MVYLIKPNQRVFIQSKVFLLNLRMTNFYVKEFILADNKNGKRDLGVKKANETNK